MTPRQQWEVNRLGIPGLNFQRDETRVYPQGLFAGHALGFVDIDGRGIAGVEKSFAERLREQDAPLALSIDARVQHVLREELRSEAHTSELQSLMRISYAGFCLKK